MGPNLKALWRASMLAAILAPLVLAMPGFAEAPANKAAIADALDKGKAAFATQNYPEAMRWLRIAADGGNADGQFLVGHLYDKGQGGVAASCAAAVAWYKKAADQGLAIAQSALGFQYIRCAEIKQNAGQGVFWLRKGAEQGDPSGQYILGMTYLMGMAIPQDCAAAHDWLSRAASNPNGAPAAGRDPAAGLLKSNPYCKWN